MSAALSRFTQSLPNTNLRFVLGFFNAPILLRASTRRRVALKKPLNIR
jgi:hypothetical protein